MLEEKRSRNEEGEDKRQSKEERQVSCRPTFAYVSKGRVSFN